ncbi:MAG: Stp1/IreP family PP2C-type Ser/Thr phosphatase [Armatimonadetes bacterium]|nr:Stp1/IreP family PP2C-type Ser/Thr phosphatase [Armatimonadota bacterium]
MKCTSCRKENFLDAKFCEHCGTPLATPVENGVTCSQCGKVNPQNTEYCQDCGASMAESPPPPSALPPLGEGAPIDVSYKVVQVLETGTTNLYLAENSRALGKKVLVREQQEASEVYRLFKDLNHPNLVRVEDYLRTNGRSYLVTSFVEGPTLKTILETSGPKSEKEVASLGIQLCQGLRVLHERNILHRNIAPSLIFLTPDGKACLGGFEESCLTEEADRRRWVSPDGFSAPEAYGVGDGHVDVRSDIYSLGLVLFQMLSNYKVSANREGLFSLPSLASLNLNVSRSLEKCIQKAVEKNPQKRFKDTREFEEALVTAAAASAEMPPLEKPLSFAVASRTDIGQVRSVNQDSFASLEKAYNVRSDLRRLRLYVVADGMGGEAEGDKASNLGIRTLVTELLSRMMGPEVPHEDPFEDGQEVRKSLREAVEAANAAVYRYSLGDPARKGMGSTMTVLLTNGFHFWGAHVGDSRGYMIHGSETRQLTEDHSLVSRLVKMGQLTWEEALRSPQRSLIYRAIGTSEKVEVDVFDFQPVPSSWLVLCSDGLWEYLGEGELASVIEKKKQPNDIADELIRIANERGGNDNITVIVLHCEQG